MLKRYMFDYSVMSSPQSLTPIITGDEVLVSITECDGNWVCKRPTAMTWEPGSLGFTTLTSSPTDPAFATFSYTGNNYYGNPPEAAQTNYAASINGSSPPTSTATVATTSFIAATLPLPITPTASTVSDG